MNDIEVVAVRKMRVNGGNVGIVNGQLLRFAAVKRLFQAGNRRGDIGNNKHSDPTCGGQSDAQGVELI